MFISQENLVDSDRSQHFCVDGRRFEIHIFRPVYRDCWSLVVTDPNGRNYHWQEDFRTEASACDAALNTLEWLGAKAFMQQESVIRVSPPVPA